MKRYFGYAASACVLMSCGGTDAVDSANPETRDDSPSLVAMIKGHEVYNRPGGCGSCHGADGKGSQTIPPLAGETAWVPGDPERLTKMVYYGVEGYLLVNSIGYDNYMPAQGPLLSDEEMAAVLTYVRNSWGNQASPIDTDMVRYVVNKYGEREPWTNAELRGMDRAKIVFELPPETQIEPQRQAEIYRHQMENSGPRTIAIGHPEDVNAIFDVEKFQYTTFWRNDFTNPGEHWHKRSRGLAPILGDHVLNFTVEASPLAVLPSPDAEWPEMTARDLGLTFKGYRLDEGRRPTLRYRWNELDVRDFLRPLADSENVVTRQLSFTTPDARSGLYYEIVRADDITRVDGNDFLVNDRLKISLPEFADPQLIPRGEKMQLILPIVFDRYGDMQASNLEIRYEW